MDYGLASKKEIFRRELCRPHHLHTYTISKIKSIEEEEEKTQQASRSLMKEGEFINYLFDEAALIDFNLLL